MGKHRQQADNSQDKFHVTPSLILMCAVACIVLGLAIKVGESLSASVEPAQAKAAAAETLTPTATAIAPVEASLPADVPTTVAPPTATAEPTATPLPTPVPPTPTPVAPRLVVGESEANVRRGPSTGYEKIGTLEPGTEMLVTGRRGDWWRIEYEGQPAYVSGELVTALDADAVPEVPIKELPGPTLTSPVFEPAPVWAIDEPRWIDVDLSEQRVTAYEGQTPVQSYLVSTGLPGTPTPEGQFRIWVKFRYDDMEGPGYFLEDVPWVMYFYNGYGFHGVWWHANWGHPMSHGCVNQPNDMAEWLFDFADVGTFVNVHA